MSLDRVKHIVLILSGKGGVGKSSVTTQLALSLCLSNHSVGILDIDLTGPNIPRFLSVEDRKVTQAPGGWIPVLVHPSNEELGIGSLRCMSLGFLLRDRGDAVVWRGPKKTAMVRQFLTDVLWDELDYLLIDTPPGTSDEHISLVETLLKVASGPSGADPREAVALGDGGRGSGEEDGGPGGAQEGERRGQLAGAVVVTTPQAISTADVRKELNFCIKTGINILGVLENMSGFICPNCSECTNIFSSGGGNLMAGDFGVRFLGSIPLDPMFVRLVEGGEVPMYPEGTGSMLGLGLGVGREGDGREDMDVDVDEGSSLVMKYRRCSLCPLFKEITKTLMTVIEEGNG